MQISGELHNRLVAEGAMVSVNGRWYVAVDIVEAATDDASPAPAAEPEPQADAEPAPESYALKERRRERKADVEGAAGSS